MAFMNVKISIETFSNKGEVGGFYLAKGSNTMPLVCSELDTVMKKILCKFTYEWNNQLILWMLIQV